MRPDIVSLVLGVLALAYCHAYVCRVMDHEHLRAGRVSLLSAFQATEEVVQLLMHPTRNYQLQVVLKLDLLSHLMFYDSVQL